MKKIIQRKLPLDKKYTLVGVKYIPLIDSFGITCDNCSKLISNIVEVRSENKNYFIGKDCFEVLLLNNTNLDLDSNFRYNYEVLTAINKAKSLRSKIKKYQKTYENLKIEIYKKDGQEQFGFSFSYSSKGDVFMPLSYDYTFNVEYYELTMNYVKDLLPI